MCDPLDDTIDQFNSLMAGVAGQLSKTDYDTEDYRLFHESLIYVCDYEERLFSRLTENERDELERNILDCVRKVENELSAKQEREEFDYNQSRERIDSEKEGEGFRISFI